ncbi:MAG: hypothetical protein SH807_06470 [Blastochloris sp.]|nr:hypothetical protein [Blastochloris sp.]
MRFFFIKFLLLVLLLSPALAGGSKSGFTFKIYMQAGLGTTPNQTVPMALRDPDQTISVNKFAVLGEKHVASLLRLPDGGTLVTMTETGSKILETETTNRMGAIMVVLCNGRLIYAPEVDSAIRSGKLLLPPGLIEEDYTLFKRYAVKREKQ